MIRICQEAEKLKQLKVKTKIVKDLYADAEEQRKKITEEAADEVMKVFKTNNETRNAVQQALKEIVAFIEGGGELDIDLSEAESSTNEKEQESSEVNRRAEIRRLVETICKDIRLLPARTGGNQDTEDGTAS